MLKFNVVHDALEAARRKLRLALELHDVGVNMMRQKLRRQHPRAAEKEIQALLNAWLSERPGAPYGDCLGKPIYREREAT